MVPPEMRQQPHVSFTQIDQYLRCPLKYKFTYVDRLEPEFVPAALAFGSGIHGAAAFLFRGRTDATAPSLADVQAFFEAYWKLETSNRPIRFGENGEKGVRQLRNGTVEVFEGGLEIPNDAGGASIIANAAAVVRLDIPESRP